ncbi:MAG: DEAD/DEAH box helicase, partial [Methylophilaceae bacterium]|nr:DEAD/DEAH box helicase [Methylophilaceae bacterium]
ESRITAIRDLRVGETAQVQGKITLVEVVRSRRPSLMVRIVDESGELFLRFLHFYPRQLALFQEGMLLRVLGEARLGARGLEMVHPTSYKDASLKPELASSLTAIYPTVAGLSQAELRRLLRLAFQHAPLTETLPPSTYTFEKTRLPSLVTSLRELHYPSPELSLERLADRTMPSWQRLAFEELLAQQLLLRTHYAQRKRELATAFAHSQTLVPTLLRGLPFTLTGAQQKVALEIANDLQCPHPMHRLLQGDVGSGKTIVACIAALQVIECQQQVALLAPTEILAEQHYQKMQTWLTPLAVKVVWLTSGQNKKQRNQSLLSIADGTAQLVIGTHAIFQKAVHFQSLGLSIVDEQHRFGVAQRLALQQKGESRPHQLMMSATPIPRTLAMSYYADLEVSIIDELPRGRSPVITKLV